MSATPVTTITVEPLLPSVVVRLPRLDHPLEHPFVDAVTLRRQRSVARLARLVPDIDWIDLANRVDDATLIVAPADASVVGELRVLEALDVVGSNHDPGDGFVNLPQPNGSQGAVPPQMLLGSSLGSRLIAGAVAGTVSDGSTLIVNGIDRVSEPIRQLTTDMMTTFAANSGTNCYVSCGDTPGFGAHWDDHDVLIVHTHGRKYWEVYEPTALSPVRGHIGDEIGASLAWSGYLEVGSALFIPRGWGHRVESTPELSVHLTISVRRLSVLGALGHLVNRAHVWPILRADVPYDLSDPPTSYGGSVFDTPGALAENVDPLLTDLIDSARASHRAQLLGPFRQSFAASLQRSVDRQWDAAVVELPAVGGVMIVDGSDNDGMVTLATGGRAITVDQGLTRLLAATAAGPTSVPDLAPSAPHLERGSLHEVVSTLVRSGVLNVVSTL